jgi:hypothetical protein
VKEPNLGINRVCVGCNKVFWCDDGDYFCSTKCSDKWESEENDDEGFEREYECEWVGDLED